LLEAAAVAELVALDILGAVVVELVAVLLAVQRMSLALLEQSTQAAVAVELLVAITLAVVVLVVQV
jgi:hypothetical protein